MSTIEPPIVELESAMRSERDQPWFAARRPLMEARIHARLGDLSRKLGDADWLERTFTVGDLMMVLVLRRLNGTAILERYPNLAAYVARGEARPAFRRAFADQLTVFDQRATAG